MPVAVQCHIPLLKIMFIGQIVLKCIRQNSFLDFQLSLHLFRFSAGKVFLAGFLQIEKTLYAYQRILSDSPNPAGLCMENEL